MTKHPTLLTLIKLQKFIPIDNKSIFEDFADEITEELNEFLLDKWIDYKKLEIIKWIKDLDESRIVIQRAVWEVEEIFDDDKIEEFNEDSMPALIEAVIDEIKNELELEKAGV